VSELDLSLFGDEHVKRYLETNGEVGYEWNGVPTLVLFTIGRKSGLERRTPLIFGRDRDAFVVIASQGGAPTHPSWFLNLLNDPSAQVQVKDQRIRVRARTTKDEEHNRLWSMMTTFWPSYDTYQSRTDRRIPLVVLERVG
jgi:deazaflavin-dependent oxidoreductase (nitroreductase family)